MAQVASCPQCNHDLLVPDGTDHESWARCPECRAFFQVNQAAMRELPALLRVAPPSPELHVEPAVASSNVDTDLELEPPQTSGALQDTAERIDDWFRSAKALPDSPPITGGETPDTPAANGPKTDVPLEPWSEEPQSQAMFDDSKHMEQLLADIKTPPTDKRPDNETPTAHDGPRTYTETIAATDVSDVPMFTKPARGQPRRKRSLVRAVAAVVVAGFFGSALGYYALLWLRGASGDFLNVAKYLPQVMLPAELQAKPTPAAAPVAAELQTEMTDDAPTNAATEPAEMQATYTTTDEPSSPKSQSVDDRYGIDTTSSPPVDEPAPLDVPAAAPLADGVVVAEPARIANAPSFTVEELTAALQAAKEAQPALVAGDLNDGREIQRAKGYSYSLLADLAQKAIFVDAISNAGSAAASQQSTQELFRQTLADAHTRRDVAVIVPKWIASPNRKHGGVFFAASLTNPKDAGTVTECEGVLETGQSTTLLVPTALTDRLEDSSRSWGIIGWIVDQPVEQVIGYTGQAQQAVWVSRFIPLE